MKIILLNALCMAILVSTYVSVAWAMKKFGKSN